MKTKRSSNLIQIAVLVLLGGVVVLSLVMPALPASSAKSQPIEISVMMREAQSGIWSNTRLGMEQAAYDLGAELRFLTPEVDNSHTSQNAILQRELQGGTDAMVIVPADVVQMEKMLSQYATNIPVVTIESPLASGKSCVTPDNEAMGRALAETCANKNSTILLLNTAENSSGVWQRLQGCAVSLRESECMVQIKDISVSDIQSMLAAAVNEYGAKTIVVFEPSATEAVLAAKSSLPEDVKIYGTGSTPQIVSALEQQSISEVAVWSDYAVGYLAVQAAINEKRNVRTEHAGQYVRYSLVKWEDIYEKNNQKLLYPVVN